MRRLTFEFIPESSGGINLRTCTSKRTWEGLRQETFKKYNNKCAVCGFDDTLECHEVWEFNDAEEIQTLTELVSLCNLCHSCKHCHFLDTIPIDVYRYHIQRVNHLYTEGEIQYFADYQDLVLNLHNKRCKQMWTISFGDYEPLIDNDRILKKFGDQWILRKAILGRE